MAEMIILLIIKSELCSWRNFHPDAGVSFWIVITIKSSCSYLFLFAYVQKPHLFSQTKPFCKNAAEDTQTVLKIVYLWPFAEKKLHKLCRLFDLSLNGPTPFICNQLSLSLFFLLPSLRSSFLEVDPTLCQALEIQRKSNSLYSKEVKILGTKEFTWETTLFSEIKQ